MGKTLQLEPSPKNHIETLMRVGYSLEMAVGDIIDNSIAAKASNIWIYSPPSDNPFISITDDGHGMAELELQENMRIGCKNPKDERDETDLGRFGSGMKTASFSVARSLTVISKKEGKPICACIYDIDQIIQNDKWIVEALSEDEILKIPELSKVFKSGHGTQLIWKNMSRYKSSTMREINENALAEDIASIKKYLSIYFHRFMEGKDKVNFFVNNDKIIPTDPFLTKEDGYTEGLSDTPAASSDGVINVQVHILPHHSKLSIEKIEALGGVDEIAKKQGFYIYRGKRLIVEGGWLGLAKSSQLGKLARIQVDVPTTMDNLLSTDVKKSSFQLPPKIKRLFKNMIADPIKKSKKKYTFRGTREEANDYWDINDNKREERITYEINSTNKQFIDLVKKLKKENKKYLIAYLKKLSEFLPLNHIYSSMSSKPKNVKQDEINWEEFEKKLNEEIWK